VVKSPKVNLAPETIALPLKLNKMHLNMALVAALESLWAKIRPKFLVLETTKARVLSELKAGKEEPWVLNLQIRLLKNKDFLCLVLVLTIVA